MSTKVPGPTADVGATYIYTSTGQHTMIGARVYYGTGLYYEIDGSVVCMPTDQTGGSTPADWGSAAIDDPIWINFNIDTNNTNSTYMNALATNWPANLGYVGGTRESLNGAPTTFAGAWSTYFSGSGAWIANIQAAACMGSTRGMVVQPTLNVLDDGIYGTSWQYQIRGRIYQMLQGVTTINGILKRNEWDNTSSEGTWLTLVSDFADPTTPAAVAAGLARGILEQKIVWEQCNGINQPPEMTAAKFSGWVGGPDTAFPSNPAVLPNGTQVWGAQDYATFNNGEALAYQNVWTEHHHHYFGTSRWWTFTNGLPPTGRGTLISVWRAIQAGNALRGSDPRYMPIVLTESGRDGLKADGNGSWAGLWSSRHWTFQGYVLGGHVLYCYAMGVSCVIFYTASGSPGAPGQNMLTYTSPYPANVDGFVGAVDTVTTWKALYDHRLYDVLALPDVSADTKSIPITAKPGTQYHIASTWGVLAEAAADTTNSVYPAPPTLPFVEWRNTTITNNLISIVAGSRVIVGRPVEFRKSGTYKVTAKIKLHGTSDRAKLWALGYDKLNGLNIASQQVNGTTSTDWQTVSVTFTTRQHNVPKLPNPISALISVDYEGVGVQCDIKDVTIQTLPSPA